MAIFTSIYNPSAGVTISCHVWNGYIYRVRYQGEVYHRLGRTGAGTQTVGLRADISQCEAWCLSNDVAAAKGFRDQFLGLSLEPAVLITDDFGEQVRVCVHSVVPRIVPGKFGYGGVSYPFAVHAQLTVEDVGTSTDAASNGGIAPVSTQQRSIYFVPGIV